MTYPEIVTHSSRTAATVSTTAAALRMVMRAALLLFSLAGIAMVPTQTLAAGEEPALTVQPTVNINTASAEELAESLHGVGVKRAEQIIAWRKQHGAFKKLEELMQIKGIGSSTIEKNRSRIQL